MNTSDYIVPKHRQQQEGPNERGARTFVLFDRVARGVWPSACFPRRLGRHLDSGTCGYARLAFARFSSLRVTHATSLDHISHLTHATCPSGRSASTS